jgi:hypothetical protein
MENKWHSFCKNSVACIFQIFCNLINWREAGRQCLINLEEACYWCFVIDQEEVTLFSENKVGLENPPKICAPLVNL